MRAALRRWWVQHVCRYRYEVCHRCGCRVEVVWHADDDLWLEIVGGPAGIRCVSCFDRECAERGIIVYWEAREVVRAGAD